MKKIIISAWAEMITLNNWWSPAKNCTPGPANSSLIKTEKAVPSSPLNKANIRYNVPISLAFEDKNHLSVQREILAFKFESFNILPLFAFSANDGL